MAASNSVEMEQNQEAPLDDENVPSVCLAEKKIQLAKRYLCSCTTSIASERTFSTAGNIITSNRSLLKPEKMNNQLIFLAKNLE